MAVRLALGRCLACHIEARGARVRAPNAVRVQHTHAAAARRRSASLAGGAGAGAAAEQNLIVRNLNAALAEAPFCSGAVILAGEALSFFACKSLIVASGVRRPAAAVD